MRYLRQEHILNRLINLHLIFGIDFVGTGPSTGDVAPPVSHSRFTEQRQFPFHATTVAVLRWQYVAKASLWFGTTVARTKLSLRMPRAEFCRHCKVWRPDDLTPSAFTVVT